MGLLCALRMFSMRFAGKWTIFRMRKGESMKPSRRDFVKIAMAGVPFSATLAEVAARAAVGTSVVDGVYLGVQTYSFHEIPYDGKDHTDDIIKDMLACGLYQCELLGPQIEGSGMIGMMLAIGGYERGRAVATGTTPSATGPRSTGPNFVPMTEAQMRQARAEELKWRLTVPVDYFRSIRKRFSDAGIGIYSYNFMYSSVDSTDEEIDRSFEMAKALGAQAINVSTTMTMLERLAPFTEKHKFVIATHGHSAINDPEQFSTRESFVKAFALSKYIGANLDIGHYTASGEDPLEFIGTFHNRITNIHVKDRKKDNGPNMEWGQGDTPIKDVLLLLKKKKYLNFNGVPIPVFIEYEYQGKSDPVTEVTKCYQFMKNTLTQG